MSAFKITCFVSAEALGTVVGCIADSVTNLKVESQAEPEPPKRRRAVNRLPRGQNSTSLLVEHFAGRTIRRAEAIQFLQRHGFAHTTALNSIRRAVEEGSVREDGQRLIFGGEQA